MTSWYCNICDKTLNIKIEPKHLNFISYRHKKRYSVLDKEYEFC